MPTPTSTKVAKAQSKESLSSAKPRGKTKTRKTRSKKSDEPKGLYDDPGEIMNLVAAKRTEMESLRTRFQDDFAIYTLEESPDFKAGYKKYTSPAPKIFFNKILDGGNRASLTIQVNTGEDAQEDERANANDAELFLIGAFNDIDRTGRRTRQKALRRLIVFSGCLRGWAIIRCLVYVPEGEQGTVFKVDVYDAMHSYWEEGVDGLEWFAYQRKATKAQIFGEYKHTIEGADATITDFWTKEKNCVLINQSEFLKDPTPHNIGHVPHGVFDVGDMPDLQTKDFSGSGNSVGPLNTLVFQGESVYSTVRGIVQAINEYTAHLMDVAERSKAGSLVHQSKKGDKKIKGDPYKSFQEIVTEEGETITALVLASAPPETAAILGILNNDWISGTLPSPLAFGGQTAAESGRALAIRIEATRSAYDPITHLLRECYQWLSEEILDQYANSARKNKEVVLHGDDPGSGEFFKVTMKPEDIQEDWIVDVIVEPRLPRDEAIEIEMALASTSERGEGKQPLLSTPTARKDILKLRNPDLEEQRVLAEMGKTIPSIMSRRIAAALEAQGDSESARLVMQDTEFRELQMQKELAAAKGETPAPADGGQGGETEAPTEDELELIEEVFAVLESAGRQDLAEELAAALGGQSQVREGLMAEIFDVLVDNGAEDLARALFAALGGGQQAQPAQQPA